MTEEDIQVIIKTESDVLIKSGVFIGKRFPYLKVNNKYYFYIDEIDEWLKEVTSSHREYDTAKGYIF